MAVGATQSAVASEQRGAENERGSDTAQRENTTGPTKHSKVPGTLWLPLTIGARAAGYLYLCIFSFNCRQLVRCCSEVEIIGFMAKKKTKKQPCRKGSLRFGAGLDSKHMQALVNKSTAAMGGNRREGARTACRHENVGENQKPDTITPALAWFGVSGL